MHVKAQGDLRGHEEFGYGSHLLARFFCLRERLMFDESVLKTTLLRPQVPNILCAILGIFGNVFSMFSAIPEIFEIEVPNILCDPVNTGNRLSDISL